MTQRSVHPNLADVTARIAARSAALRSAYETRMRAAELALQRQGRARAGQGCANLAHAYASAHERERTMLTQDRAPHIGIISAYNDMLSAHQPYGHYPAIIKTAAQAVGATAQVAGGVPAMCDGITQGEAGMELSLFSRDTIALATAVGLSHNVFDAALCLGVCDKIVPGLFIGAAQFGHLPIAFVPAGPMSSGLSNPEKAKVREQFARGEVGRPALLQAEMAAYHDVGTCTFYGTANSNQMLMEIMGLHLPGSSFVAPYGSLRKHLTAATTAAVLTAPPLYRIATAANFANAIVGLLATGGSTNHTLHLVAMARAAGLIINWDDFDQLSRIVPLLARVYPNGLADVNHFHAAGGMGVLIQELLGAGLLHPEVHTILGPGLAHYTQEPVLVHTSTAATTPASNVGAPADAALKLAWRPCPQHSIDAKVLASVAQPFAHEGGLQLLSGNLGRAVMKVSAVASEHRTVRARAVVVHSQQELQTLFKAGQLQRDCIAVLRYQGPRANGMPELHKLTPLLSVLQNQGFHVALVSDGRMSGASGKVPTAIHVSPEAAAGGTLALVENGDMITLDGPNGCLQLEVDETTLAQRRQNWHLPDLSANQYGCGRELFGLMRRHCSTAEEGACSLFV